MKSFLYMPILLMALFSMSLSACQAKEPPMQPLPRNEKPPLFQPHVADFPCKIEAAAVPPIDAQADQWFRESLARDSADIYTDDKDYQAIVRLMQQAAQRRHWKAMLNLASLYIERRDPGRGVEDAVKLVEELMRLGVPAAYDRMGTYYLNGTGVPGDSTKGYAFMQKAAQMGNAASMHYLAEKMRAGEDGALPGYWSNIPIAIKMFECALSQGYGPAGEYLSVLYANPGYAEPTESNKARALQVLQDGTKFGCHECAISLFVEFGDPIDLKNSPAPYIDPARAKRYQTIGHALQFDPSDRFPNLDKVLPLPPAALPPWNGDRDTLLYAARGVTLAPSKPPSSTPTSQATGQYFLDAAYALRATGETATGNASFEGYWKPQAPAQSEPVQQHIATIQPGLYKKGENFPAIRLPDDHRPVPGIAWKYYITIPHDHDAVAPRAPKGMTREMPHSAPLRSTTADENCTVSGIWQPWLKSGHPLQALINQPSRQSWIVKGQPFPHPERDWHLPITEQDVSWHLLDDSGPQGLDADIK
ncbi:tetratricopeptide repeat protein [Pseudoduganella umbonata]|nr:tetratricopeptide repeat protein [Pseudoduganella umbonata]MBB3223028.1 TPR repeat protein [Pseudoduganella umbonata]